MISALSVRTIVRVSLLMIAVVALLFSSVTAVHAQATSTPRLEQLVKDVRVATTLPGSYPPVVQPISCYSLSGQIQTVTVSIESTGSSGGNSKVTAFFTGWNGYPTYAISDTQTVSAKRDHAFTFSSPVDVSVICPDPNGYAYLALTNTDSRAYVYGSSSLGWYYIINGVAQVNHPPVLQPIGDQTTFEGKYISFSAPSAIDNIDGGPMTVTVSGLPDGATFDGALHWTPRFDQAGNYQVTFTVSDDGNQGQFVPETVSQTITITVLDAVPELHRLEQLVKDTQLATLRPGSLPPRIQAIACQELSGQIVDVTVSLDSLPGNGVTAFFTGWNGYPTYAISDSVIVNSNQQDYTFSFYTPVDTAQLCPDSNGYAYLALTSSGLDAHVWGSSTLGWYYIVNPSASTNHQPMIDQISNRIVNEGQPLQFTVSATDPDAGDVVTHSANNLPTGASFNPQTGLFSWTPTYEQTGTYANIEFVATDNGNPMASTSEVISITVNDVNRAPVLDSIGNKTVNENQVLSFTLSASDPDGDALTYSATNLPAGATFDPQTRTFSWTPTYAQAGNYENIEFTVTDDGSPMQLAVEVITITVGNTNRPPVFALIGSQEVLENNALSFAVSAIDPDGDVVILSASSTPIGATFDSGAGTFSWTPSLSQAGIYVVSFIATDDGAPSETSMVEVVITVGDNPTPTEQAQSLVDGVVSAPISNTLENSYLANLNKVGIFIEQGKIQPAINQLNAFIQKVGQDYAQGIITLQQRDDFIAQAQHLIDALN